MIKEVQGNGVTSTVPDIDGRKEGEERTYDSLKRLIRRATWVNGKLEGIETYYYTSGQVYHEVLYKNGLRTGAENWYYKDGKLRSSMLPGQAGGLTRLKAWDTQGTLVFDRFIPSGRVNERNWDRMDKSLANRVYVTVAASFVYTSDMDPGRNTNEARDLGFSVELRSNTLTLERGFASSMPIQEILVRIKDSVRIAKAVMNTSFSAVNVSGVRFPMTYIDNPESIPAEVILRENNINKRRLLLEMCGYSLFLSRVKHAVIDQDGDMSLILIDWHSAEEPMMLLKVKCASTGVFYTLRVPPKTRTCAEGVSWTFNVDATEYKLDEES